MYQRSNSTELRYARSGWSDSIKKLRTHRYSKRVTPFRSDAKHHSLATHRSAKSPIHAASLQKALMHMMKTQKLPHSEKKEDRLDESLNSTPELSINEQSSHSTTPSSYSSSYASSVVEEEFDGDNESETSSIHISQASAAAAAAAAAAVAEKDTQSLHGYSSPSDDELEITRFTAKKSRTCPNLSIVTNTDFQARPLPPLPDKEVHLAISSSSIELCSKTSYLKKSATMKLTRAASKGQVHLKRAATWLGLASQKLLSSSQVQSLGLLMTQKYTTANSVLRFSSNSSRSNKVPALSISSSSVRSSNMSVVADSTRLHHSNGTKKLRFSEELVYGTDLEHVAYLRDQLGQRSMSTEKRASTSMSKKTLVTPRRIMYCRVMQIINLASTRDCEYELTIQLNDTTMTTKRGFLRKVEKSTSADRPYDEALVFEVEEPFSLNFVVSARHTNTILREGLAHMGVWPLKKVEQVSNSSLPIAGYTCLNFQNKMNILDQGVSRFRLSKPVDKPSNRWMNLELLIDIKVEEVLPAVVHRFPWSYTTNEYSSGSYESTDDEHISDPQEILMSRKHCQKGDYLTIYTRGRAHPTWKRYWAILEDNQLVLHDFTFKNTKEPLSIISLAPLLTVSKPSLEDCENVGIARKTGIMLQFNRSSAILTEPVRLDSDEGLEGKSYIYGDNERNTVHWRRALNTFVSDKSKRLVNNGEDGVDLRFLW